VRIPLVLLLLVLPACATRMAAPSRLALEEVVDGEVQAGKNRSIISTVQVRLERAEPEKGPAEAVTLAKAHGGYAQLVTDASATVRIPAGRLDTFLEKVPALGTVAERRVSAEDVTETHRDLKVRLETLERARQRYLQLLDKAASVSEAVLVEKELERVTVEYEALKARLEALEGAVALATVQLDFGRPVRPGPVGWIFYGLARGVKWLFIWD
jgi:GTP1/Obg family GTP-binding protein